jgi:hypothetical protein
MAKTNRNQPSNLAALLAAMKHPQAAAVAASAPQAPAATAPLPGWVVAAQQVQAQAPQPTPAPKVQAAPKVPASQTRTWQPTNVGESKAGNPWIQFTTTTANGRSFTVTVPADLVAFIAAQGN